ncbi:MAG: hypothetical protein IKY54_05855 [Muribaculaceae bacterium]|nr:hypothetical protein [Muribaculaceae bacterium]
MKQLKNYISIINMLVVLFTLMFTSCSGDGNDDGLINNGGGSLEPAQKHNGHEYVDLGLSVKWATCNVGATTPEGYGDYFAWGETEPKDVFSLNTYKWGEITEIGNILYLKYNRTDNNIVLELEDDAARVNWGGEWRMATIEEQKELLNKCTWTWFTKNGVKGYKVISNINGNSIFLPAAGCFVDDNISEVGELGEYNSNTLDDYSIDCWGLAFISTEYDYGAGARYFGKPVRPVCP